MPTSNNPDLHQPPNPLLDLAAIFAQLFKAIADLLAPDGDAEKSERLRSLLDRESEQAAETAKLIEARYPNAWSRRDEIVARAGEHDVVFSRFLSDAHKLAILDFLDNPRAQTPLDWGHMTQFWVRGPDGMATTSCTHPVNRAIYRWNAGDLERRGPTGVTSVDAALARLRQHYPIERCAWTAAQWSAYETASSEPNRPKCAGSVVGLSCRGIPNAL